ncbi:MAG: hypothetical protein GYB67_13105 [Chloroflexi bacterium]|nr:hypothetical protein [Chloroflexota bacterium]
MPQRIHLLVAVLAALLILSAQPTITRAHGYIVRAIPEDRAVLDRAPARLQYWFSEALEPAFSGLIVRDQAGNVIAEGGVAANDNTLLTVRLPANLPDGAYINELRPAFASDGHVIVESRVFFVGESVSGVAGAAANDQAVPLEVVWRALVLASTMLLFGVYTLYALVLVPAWGSRDHRAGWLPPRVMTRLNRIVWIALAVAIGGNLLALLQQTMVFFAADVGRVLSDGLWNVVRIGSRFGDTWNVRMALLLLIAGLHFATTQLRRDQPDTVRPFWIATAWLLPLLLGTWSIASHASGSLLWPWLAVFSDWLHGIAAGLWVGGAAALALILPAALRPYSGEDRRLALLAALRRFSRIAVVALALVIATGVYNALNWFGAPAEIATSYGESLGLKLLLIAPLLVIGAGHHIALRPERYARWSALMDRFGVRFGAFVPTLRLEALIGLGVLVLAAHLSATPVPEPELAGQTTPPPQGVQTVGATTVRVTITPGGPGVNTYDTVVMRGDQPATDVTVRLRTANPARDLRGAWHATEALGDGLYVAAGAEIDAEGRWQTLIDVTDASGAQVTRAVFAWEITQDAAVIATRDPNVFNVLALFGALAAVGFAVSPFVRRGYHQLNLDAASVTVAAVAVAATVVIVVVGILAGQEAERSYRETLNPPPQIVNDVLPTQASLARGQDLIVAQCPAWIGANDFITLTRRLDRTRDEALYAAVRDGWRDLGACAPDLRDGQRWDIVNYIRSLEGRSLDGRSLDVDAR